MAIGNVRMDAGRQTEENCLKVILTLHMDKGCAYISDIAEGMDIPVGTAYSMVNRLVKSGYIKSLERTAEEKGTKQSAEFTEKGETVATQVFEKHKMIYEWLLCLGIPEDEADEEACHWEHSITERTMEAIRHHVSIAMQSRSGQSPAEGKMQEMMRTLDIARENVGKTATGKLLSLLDECGGSEGLRRKIQMSKRAGGDDHIEAAIVFCEEHGGSERLPELNDLCSSIDERGGIKQYRDETALIDGLGGVKKLTRLKNLMDKMGGIDSALAILRNSYRLWSAALGSGNEYPDDEDI